MKEINGKERTFPIISAPKYTLPFQILDFACILQCHFPLRSPEIAAPESWGEGTTTCHAERA